MPVIMLAALFLAWLPGAERSTRAADHQPPPAASGRGHISLLESPVNAPAAQLLTPTPAPTATFSVNQYLPLVIYPVTPAVELTDTYTRDEEGIRRAAYLPGEPFSYITEGVNNRQMPLTATLQIVQTSACGDGLVFSAGVILPAGPWQHEFPNAGLGCSGVYTTTVSLAYQDQSSDTKSQFVVNPPSAVVHSGFQGFDRCHLPTVAEMQAWWDSSPYWVYNLYLGGSNFFCWEEIPDPVWVHRVAQQGWTFIQAWVGPQAPCSGFTHRMSADPGIAYLEGRAEAAAAAAASQRAGLFENGVIYYDIEGYPNASSSCRNAVKSFLRGWTEQLHELGLRSGSYGSPCNSYITEWAAINPPPDDIWIAHWYRPSYDPSASVYNTPCLSDSLWANDRRIKQYAGDHAETWGQVTLVIDTDVLDGEITALPVNLAAAAGGTAQVTVSLYGTPLSGLGLIGPSHGWVLAEGRLLFTADSGAAWDDITPPGFEVLDAEFLDQERAWALGWTGSGQGLAAAHSVDGGRTWEATLVSPGEQAEMVQINTGWLGALDENHVWVALKLQSGSSFSLGRLFVTEDGGKRWQERSLPHGEPVVFADPLHGWTVGGPAGKNLFHTADGGITWTAPTVELPAGSRTWFAPPQFPAGGSGRLPVLLEGPAGVTLVQYAAVENGEIWQPASAQLIDRQGLISPELTAALEGLFEFNPRVLERLPSGTIAADFLDPVHGWAIVQEGQCSGKTPPTGSHLYPGVDRVVCRQAWRLLETRDGGLSWRELLPG